MSSQILDLRSLRQESGFKQKDLAELVGIGIHDLMKIERGLMPLEEGLKTQILKALSVDELSVDGNLSLLRAIECGEGYVTAKPKLADTRGRKTALKPNTKPIYDLFCGVGGFSSGFEQTEEFQVAAGIDLLGDRLDTFVSNHGTANAYGQDIRVVKTNILDNENPRPFIIVGGPPCQGFSSIRPFRNVEWNDPRNNLVEEFCRIVNDTRPEWVVFENVVGLVSHEKGKTFQSILAAFADLGYRTDARVLNAAFYGLPQRRERLIIVGSLKGKAFKWPEPTHFFEEHRSMVGKTGLLLQPNRKLDLQPAVTVNEALGDLPVLEAGEKATAYNEQSKMTSYASYIRNKATRLTMHEATSHSPEMINIIKHAGANIHALPPGLVTSGFSSCYSRLDGNEPSVTITVNFVHPASNRCIHPWQNRALTPREGARLQGFFDTFNFAGSRSQIVKQIGNAVPPLLGKKIAEAILESD